MAPFNSEVRLTINYNTYAPTFNGYLGGKDKASLRISRRLNEISNSKFPWYQNEFIYKM